MTRPLSPDLASLEEYPGAKGGAGVFQTIINQIPPHDLWIEAFAGSAIITRRKRPARASVVIDSDAAVCAALSSRVAKNGDTAGVTVVQADAVVWLTKKWGTLNARTVVYCDPPYLSTTLRQVGRQYYAESFNTETLHRGLISILHALSRHGVKCLISGYQSQLYQRAFPDWRRVEYRTRTHGGTVTESLWCNFPEPTELHDYRFLGHNRRERERIKRKLARWKARLEKMPLLERRLIAAAVAENGGAYRDATNGDSGH